jgi:predicted DNA-binding transcriptional regulator AlpA
VIARVSSLDQIATNPESAVGLPLHVVAGLLLKVAAVESALATALLDPDNCVGDVPAPIDGDRLLVIEEAAAKLAVTEDFLYRRKDLPFRVKVGPGQVRFSSKGIDKFIRAKTSKGVE